MIRQGTEALPELAVSILIKNENGPGLTIPRYCSSG